MGGGFYLWGRSLPSRPSLLHDNVMLGHATWTDPLALSSGTGARLVLAAGVAALLWLGVLWAMTG
ncbi:hypothetical protein GCM10010964_30420 [Caldovatus sediminis]|uniref:Uncharacterized protein n=1 Tax=Caldovatus sediminis TaxID=2041189 RepID=A0A8J2ZDB0_9PROT|nr:hypothetical protein GCM10010964_30420 [Caldovatus sediminis]